MFQDKGLMPSEKMAGMMAAAILSDTVMFKSPTCTDRDRRTAERMARIANVSLEELGRAIFSASTLVISTTTFIAIFVYEKLGYNMDKTVLLMFALSALFFGGVFFVKFPWVNLALIVLAIMAANGAACMLWSRYCPGLAGKL